MRCLILPLLLLATTALAAPPVTPESLLASGPSQPAALDMTLHDQARDKDLPIKIRYPAPRPATTAAATPAAPTPCPIILFSHGAGGDRNTFADLTAHWASRGYVVVLPTHSDSLRLRKDAGEDLSAVRDNPRLLVRDVKPLERLADLTLILDSLDAIEKAVAEQLKLAPDSPTKLLDGDHIAVAGHSAGALTAQLALGVQCRTRDHPLRLAAEGDKRFACGIIISGQGTTNLMFTKDSWAKLDKPMLVLAGSLDTSPISNETPESRKEPFQFAKPGDKYLVYIDGATHGSYAGKEMTIFLREKPTTDLKTITDLTTAATTAFLDAYLKADANAKTFLQGQGIGDMSPKAKWESK